MRLRHFAFFYVTVLTSVTSACATANPAAEAASRQSRVTSGRLGRVQGVIENTIASANSAIQELNQIEADIATAELERDGDFFERLAADEFLFIDDAGAVTTKAETVAAIGQPRAYNLESSSVDQVTIKLFGDAAIVWGRRTLEGRDTSGRPMTSQFRFTHVLQRWGGQWHLTAAHQSRIPRRPAAAAPLVAISATF